MSTFLYEDERRAGPPHFGERLREHDGVMLGQPVLEQRIRYADRDRAFPPRRRTPWA